MEGDRVFEPKTPAEKLDAASNGEQFAKVLGDLFSALEEAMNQEDDDA